ncbi:MAG: hypothetical protein EOM54_14420 [Clostridia bacterium]|nr:hypothetical protein [Clostridia bacterium]
MKKDRIFACVLGILTIVLTGFVLTVPARAAEYSGYWSDEGCYSAPELADTTYEITSPGELAWVAAQTDNSFDGYTIALETDIDLCGHYWKPIRYFKGTFEGNNHTISNLRMGAADAPYSSEYAGLFREIFGAVIQNVDIEAELYVDYAESYDGQWRYKTTYIGGVAARASDSAITNCSVSGDMSTEHTSFIGGIAGYGYSLTITECTVSGSVTGGLVLADVFDTEIPYAGLIIGYSEGDGGISGCNASGSVTCGDYAYAGGIAGTSTGISDCSFTGSVTCGSEAYAGGLVGVSNGNVGDCHVSGDIKGSGTLSGLGGLIGYADGGTIKSCYSTGSVENGSNSTSAGFIAHAGHCIIENCFSSADVKSGDDSTAGGFIVYGANNSVENCYATGSLTGGKNCIMDGFSPASFQSDFTNCYAAGDVTGGSDAMISVFNKNPTLALSCCYWNTDADLTAYGITQSNDTNAVGLSAVQMTRENAAANMAGFGFSGTDSVWVTADNAGSVGYYPQLRVFADSADADIAASSRKSVETDAYYKVFFNIGASTQKDTTALTQWVIYGGDGIAPALQMPGYLLCGWNSYSLGWYSFDVETGEIAGDTTFYSFWKTDTGYKINGITLCDSDGKVTDAIPASAFTAQVSVDMPGAPDVYYYVILAAYDASGRLTDIRCTSAATDYGKVLRFSFELDGGAKSISGIKVMLLDVQGGPVTEAAVF